MSDAHETTVPRVLEEFWDSRGGEGMSGDHFEIFSPDEIGERNLTLETSVYCPGYLAIASDAGSIVALMKQESNADEVYTVDASSMKPDAMKSSGFGLKAWISKGCPFSRSETTPGPCAIQQVKIVMVERPNLKELTQIRSKLGLSIGLSELKDMPLPSTLTTMSYFRAAMELAELGLNTLEIHDIETGSNLPIKVSRWKSD